MCDHETCAEEGMHRAPKDRQGQAFYWFCMPHVRAYNTAWNYYKDEDDTAMEGHIRSSVTWDRPSWPLYAKHARHPFINALGLEDVDAVLAGFSKPTPPMPRPRPEIEEALMLFDLGVPFSKVELRLAYRKLVKIHHPDSKQDALEKNTSTQMIQKINVAYALLKKLVEE